MICHLREVDGARRTILFKHDLADAGKGLYPAVNARLMLIERTLTAARFGFWIALCRRTSQARNLEKTLPVGHFDRSSIAV